MNTEDLATALSVTDELLSTATMDDMVEALRIACLMIAEHQRINGEVPMERIFEVLQTEEIDEDTAGLLFRGFQNMTGILGTVVEIQSEEEIVH